MGDCNAYRLIEIAGVVKALGLGEDIGGLLFGSWATGEQNQDGDREGVATDHRVTYQSAGFWIIPPWPSGMLAGNWLRSIISLGRVLSLSAAPRISVAAPRVRSRAGT